MYVDWLVETRDTQCSRLEFLFTVFAKQIYGYCCYYYTYAKRRLSQLATRGAGKSQVLGEMCEININFSKFRLIVALLRNAEDKSHRSSLFVPGSQMLTLSAAERANLEQ